MERQAKFHYHIYVFYDVYKIDYIFHLVYINKYNNMAYHFITYSTIDPGMRGLVTVGENEFQLNFIAIKLNFSI